MITLTTGTAFIMWLGEQITERGIGNGISLIIFAGIVVRIPAGDRRSSRADRAPTSSRMLASCCSWSSMVVVVGGFVVFVERGQRRIPIQHARRVVGRTRDAGRA